VTLFYHTHRTKRRFSSIKHQEPVCEHLHTARFKVNLHHALTYLISSTFSATSMHIDERKRFHHESRYVVYKNHDLLYCDKKKEPKAAGQKAVKWSAVFSPELYSQEK